MDLKQRIQYQYNTAGVVEKLIAINVIAFVFVFLLKTISFLFQLPDNSLLDWLVFPKDLAELAFKPWTIITYAFLHAGIWHILSNMIILYFAGRLFLTYFSSKRLLNYYFLGAISGALIYMLSYNLFPVFQGLGRSYLIGASAAVMAILVGVATQAPNMQIRLLIIGNIKLWWIAAFLVVLDVIQIPMGNPGGHLAHLGGAGLGYLYTTQLNKGNDIGEWWEKIMDWFAGLFSANKKSPLKTVYKNKQEKKQRRTSRKSSIYKKDPKDVKQQKIDAILDKISKNGYESLSKAEKEYLFNAGKE